MTIPVGPYPSNKRWLNECLDSVFNQTVKANEVIVIDDQANLSQGDVGGAILWKTPWLSGVSHAFNFGIGVAQSDLVFMLGSDDTMKPKCLETCLKAFDINKRKDGYYWVTIDYINTMNDVRFPPGSMQRLPCNEAFVTKKFWHWVGGFPIEAALGAPDSMLMELMYHRIPDKLFPVADGTPLVSYRLHEDTETERSRKLGRFAMVDLLKPVVVKNWQPVGTL